VEEFVSLLGDLPRGTRFCLVCFCCRISPHRGWLVGAHVGTGNSTVARTITCDNYGTHSGEVIFFVIPKSKVHTKRKLSRLSRSRPSNVRNAFVFFRLADQVERVCPTLIVFSRLADQVERVRPSLTARGRRGRWSRSRRVCCSAASPSRPTRRGPRALTPRTAHAALRV
jgi:hypothetical protein